MSIELILFALAVILQGLFSVWLAVKKQKPIFILINLLIIFTFGIKPYLSCDEHYVIYNGCDADPDVILMMWSPVFLFFTAQIINLFLIRKAEPIVSACDKLKKKAVVLTILSLLAIYQWNGLSTFSEFTESRLAKASASGISSLIFGSALICIISLAKYKNSFNYSLLIGVASFLASGQKLFLLLPIVLWFFENEIHKKINFNNILIIIFLPFLLIIVSQYARDENAVISFDGILFLVAIPFDAFDNSAIILQQLIKKHNFYEFLMPIDLNYLLEIISQAIPRSIWPDKPAEIGFWKVQKMYLPDLYTSPDEMSVAISMQVDLIMSFGFILMPLVLFAFCRIVSYAELNDNIYKRILFSSIIVFSNEFVRGGFRTAVNILIGLFVIFLFIHICKIIYHGWNLK